MKELIAFTEYLNATGYELGVLNFNEAVALHSDVKKLIQEHYTNALNK